MPEILALSVPLSPEDWHSTLAERNLPELLPLPSLKTHAPIIDDPHMTGVEALRRLRLLFPAPVARRVAIIASQAFVAQGQAEDALCLASHLLDDEEDLMHKAPVTSGSEATRLHRAGRLFVES